MQINQDYYLTSVQMEELLSMIGLCVNHETKESHTLGEKQLPQIVLQWLGTEGQYHSVHNMHGVFKASVCIPLSICDRR